MTNTPSIALAIDGAWNARDAATLTHCTPNTLFRSSALFALTPDGAQELLNLGVTDVIDLRSLDEVATNGSDQLPEGITLHSLPIDVAQMPQLPTTQGADTSMAGLLSQFKTMLGDQDPLTFAKDYMQKTYQSIALTPNFSDQVGKALTIIANAPGATLVHCSAGKDRTGVTVALAARIAGASMSDIEADYLYSNHATEQQQTLVDIPGVDPALLQPFLGVDSSYLQAAFAAIEAQHPSFEAYLESIGVPQETQARLAQRLRT